MPHWIQAAAEELHDSLDEIEEDAGRCGQCLQDPEAGFEFWLAQVAKIIAKHHARYERERLTVTIPRIAAPLPH